MNIRVAVAIAAVVGATGSFPLRAQVQTDSPPLVLGAKTVVVDRIQVHSTALEGNLEGESADRDVLVFLPPSYAHGRRRYAVVYALHGYSIGAEQWTHEIHVPQTLEGAFARGAMEMIIVLPDSKTAYGGSIYSSSVTTGDFEAFIAHDLVSYIDGHYRTLADRRSRGLVCHSMGGYGAARIGMKHPEVFASLYIMSPGLLAPHSPELPFRGGSLRPDEAQKAFESSVAALRSPQDAQSLPLSARAQLAVAAAWSPNPNNPPLYLDLPLRDGKVETTVIAKWAANAPLAFFDQYIGSLRQYQAIGLDVGDQDPGREDAKQLDALFERYKIAVRFEVYHGTHTSAVADRFQNHVVPFFAESLR